MPTGSWDRVITLAIDALVRTSEFMALNANLSNARAFIGSVGCGSETS